MYIICYNVCEWKIAVVVFRERNRITGVGRGDDVTLQVLRTLNG